MKDIHINRQQIIDGIRLAFQISLVAIAFVICFGIGGAFEAKPNTTGEKGMLGLGMIFILIYPFVGVDKLLYPYLRGFFSIWVLQTMAIVYLVIVIVEGNFLFAPLMRSIQIGVILLSSYSIWVNISEIYRLIYQSKRP